MWKFTGQQRLDFAIEPGDGEESVWDYPRPPALRNDPRLVEVKSGERLLARSESAVRICETASPPTFYLPPEDVDLSLLTAAPGSSFCEWKGAASYWALADHPSEAVGWSYPQPAPAFAAIAGWLSFYPARVDCFVAGEKVRPQPGGFYGGWVTNEIVGPYKGEPGTGGW